MPYKNLILAIIILCSPCLLHSQKAIVDSSKVTQYENHKKKAVKNKKMNTYTDIYQMIRMEVSGVIVTGRSVHIQQGHSFFGSSDPLFVVNGVIVQNIDGINPTEVKSITILKGSAAAVYGVQGSNGVVNITLKNGKEEEQ